MKRTKWTKEELDFLKKHWDLPVKILSQKLDRTEKAIRGRFEILNISLRDKKNLKFELWTKEEENFLKENYHKFTVKELSQMLNRSESGIIGHKHKLGLNDKYKRTKGNFRLYDYKNNYTMIFDKKNNTLTAYHRKVYEDFYNIKLTKTQKIHHIDGDKKNNDISNLLLTENVNEHRKIHAQLEKIAFQLIREKFIIFDKKQKKYIANSNRRLIKDKSGATHR